MSYCLVNTTPIIVAIPLLVAALWYCNRLPLFRKYRLVANTLLVVGISTFAFIAAVLIFPVCSIYVSPYT